MSVFVLAYVNMRPKSLRPYLATLKHVVVEICLSPRVGTHTWVRVCRVTL